MAEPKYILALDVGQRRIGVALANSIARMASPLTTLINDEDLFDKLKELIEENHVDTVVIGLPRGLEGQETAQTTYVREFSKTFQDKLKIDYVFQDEAVTSVIAEQELKQGKKPYKKEDIDMVAARQILEDYLHSEIL
jgi:putative Holliday junction resolvase